MNGISYDTCAYAQELAQSVSPLSYTLDPLKYEHCDQCRPQLGIVGGTAVSHIKGNLVDLENDLQSRNRPLTRCPQFKYLPHAGRGYVQGKEYIKPVCHPRVDTTPQNLRPCQFASYPQVPHPPAPNLFVCPQNS